MRNVKCLGDILVVLVAVSLLVITGCEPALLEPLPAGTNAGSGDDDDNDNDDNDDNDTDDNDETGDGDENDDADGDDDDDNDADDNDSDTQVEDECWDDTIEISMKPAKLMILQDMSSSMQQGSPSKWEQAKNALTSMLSNVQFSDIEFGFDVFPNGDDCDVSGPVVADAHSDSASSIVSLLNSATTVRGTPLYVAMKAFLDSGYAPQFTDGTMDSYLLVVSDGADNCGTTGVSMGGGGATGAEFGALTSQLLNNLGVKTFVIGFGSDVDADQLNGIAAAGGTDYTSYIVASDEATLAQAFEDIGAEVAGCTYTLELTEQEIDDQNIDVDLVDILIDGFPAGYLGDDEECAPDGAGWRWVDKSTFTFELCDGTCAELNDGSKITIRFGCDPEPPDPV